MTYTFKFISEEVEGFLREIEIDSDATFLDLAKLILKACDYPDDQMTSFFVYDEEWEGGKQVTREDMGAGKIDDDDIYVMNQTLISELIEEEGQNLEFIFDPFSERLFYMTVKASTPGKSLSEGEIIRSQGKAPVQLAELDFTMPAAVTKKVSEDDLGGDDIFSNSMDFNDDEIDLEGFEISDGEALY